MKLPQSLRWLLVGAALACGWSNARAEPIPVAILGSPSIASWNDDVRAKVLSTGFFSTVDVFDIATTTPTLAQLMNYQSVLVYTDARGFANRPLFGDILADYVDSGRGVVVATFANASNSNSLLIGGRFNTADYWAIRPANQSGANSLTLGTIHDPTSSLLAGVNSFNGGVSSFHVPGTLHPDAVRIADWSNGAPLVASREIGDALRVDLNFFPPSNAVRSDFWQQNTDGALLMGNALRFAGRGEDPPIPEPASLTLVGVGALGLLGVGWRRRARNGTPA